MMKATALFDAETEVMENWCVSPDNKPSKAIPNLRIWFDKKTGRIKKTEIMETTHLIIPGTEIDLHPGEHYAGIIIGKGSEVSYHLILLPGEADDLNWSDAKAWAAQSGGDLPNRREQSLLYANCKDQFTDEWHWSSEAHEDSRYAWAQSFRGGGQSYGGTNDQFRARAVRRLVIE